VRDAAEAIVEGMWDAVGKCRLDGMKREVSFGWYVGIRKFLHRCLIPLHSGVLLHPYQYPQALYYFLANRSSTQDLDTWSTRSCIRCITPWLSNATVPHVPHAIDTLSAPHSLSWPSSPLPPLQDVSPVYLSSLSPYPI